MAMCALVIAFAPSAGAQSTTAGAIGGSVVDQSKAVIPGAGVSVKNVGTNRGSTATTDESGRFRIVSLQPGEYQVEVTVQGFSPYKRGNVIVEVGLVTTVEIELSVAGTVETIETTAEAPVINTQQQDFASNINQKAINELPINGRRWSNFALLTPGATPDGNFGLISFRGISGLLNNNTVDGGDNNQAFFAEERGRTRISYVISQASIQEFQVNTSNYSAEYGRSAGGVVNAVTKSGSNQYHGSLFYYIRDNGVGATNAFTTILTPAGVTQKIKPTDRRQQFGGNIGGPVFKDKLFFFFNYDQQKRNFPGVANPGNPGSFLGDFIALTGSRDCTAPAAGSDYAILCARGLTVAQMDGGLSFLRSIAGVVPRTGSQQLYFPKVDWRITGNHNLAVSYNALRWNSPAGIQTQPVVARGIASFGDDIVKVDSVNARLNSVFGGSITNEFRFQWGRDFEAQRSQPPAPGEPTTGPGGRPPQIGIGGSAGITIGKPNFLERRSFPDEKRRQFADTVAIMRGKHLLKIGIDVNLVSDLNDNLFTEGGAYTYSNRLDFITDFVAPPGNIRRFSNYSQGFGPAAFRFHTKDVNFFVQDDWRVHPRLTVNLGLRYEAEYLPKPQIPVGIFPATNRFPFDGDNIGPRLGAAWDVLGRGRLVIRGGYGVFYGRVINSTISNAITNTGSTAGQLQFSFSPTTAGAPIYPAVLSTPPTLAGARPDIVVFDSNFSLPLIHQFDGIVEWEFMRNTVLSVSYVGSLGRSLPQFLDRNLPATTTPITYRVVGGSLDGQAFSTTRYTGSRPNANFARITAISSVVESRYDALILQVNRRFTSGLQFQSSYTYAKASDNGQISQTFTTGNGVLDPNRLGLEQARSNFEFRNRFVANAVWQPNYFKDSGAVAKALLSNYTISPIISVFSGRPYTGTVSGNPSGCPSGLGGIVCASGSNRPFFTSRNEFVQPRTTNIDLRISRRFAIREAMKVEFLVEAFNLFNHLNVTDVNNRQYQIGLTTAATLTGPTTLSACPTPLSVVGIPAGTQVLCLDSTFGLANAAGNTLLRERQLQFGVRFEF